ncbi:MAG: FtsH protease activity modulator HflK [Halanaerobiales bacterium]|nr:FtsH protease activity modulator HflK [Halanaerobiales bacterium]
MERKIIKYALLLIIVLVVIAFATNGFYIIRSGEQAVLERFGEKIKVVTSDGINFKIPLIDQARIVNTEELHTIQYGYQVVNQGGISRPIKTIDNAEESTVLTKGSYLVDMDIMIQYKINDIANFLYKVDDPIGTLRLAFESVLRRNVQNKLLDDALINKDVISMEILPELRKKINNYELGIKIQTLEIQNITVPSEVRADYDDVINAGNEKIKLEEEGKKYRNEVIPKARAEAYGMIQEAEAYKAKKISQSKGDVERFKQVYEKYRVAKDITKTRLRLEAVEEVLSKTSYKWIFDLDDSGTIKYLPLEPSQINPKGGK